MNEQLIDPVVYGATQAAAPVRDPIIPKPEPVDIGEAAQSASLQAQGKAAADYANRVPATGMESIKAAVSEWVVPKLYKAYNAPDFAIDAEHDASGMLSAVQTPLSKDEAEYLLKTTSPEEFKFKLDNIEHQQKAGQVIADHPWLGGTTALLDPAYIGVSLLSGGGGYAARLAGMAKVGQKAGAAVAAGSMFYGVGRAEQSILPMSDAMVYGQALAFGALEGMIYSTSLRKLVKADPDFPGPKLNQIADDITNMNIKPLADGHPEFVGPVQVFADHAAVPDQAIRDVAKGMEQDAKQYTSTSAQDGADNLTRSRVAATGEGEVKLKYQGADVNADYIPTLKLSRAEQESITKVQSVSDIASHAKSVREGFAKVDADAKAVYLPSEDRVFLILDNIKPTDDLKGIILHEYGVHMNAERVLGTEQLGKMLTSLEDMALAGNARAKAAFAAVPKDTPQHLLREEALGYFVEHNVNNLKDTIISKLVAGVRQALRKAGIALELTENDIMQLVRKAAKAKVGSFDAAFPYAWHGSSVKGIEQLDTAYMGSGEGVQAYGWGHYLSSEKGTALDYRNKEALRRGMKPDDGGLYRVKLNAKEHEFIDLDTTKQSATVQAAFENLGVSGGTGRQAYNKLTKLLGSQKAASEALLEQGVKGNRYATGRTRKADVKSSNFVMFGNDGVDMAARYSKPANPTLQQAVKDVTKYMDEDKGVNSLGRKIEWNLRRTIAALPGGEKIAGLFVDDPLNFKGNSVTSQKMAIRRDLSRTQYEFNDALAAELAARGHGLFSRTVNKGGKAMRAQEQLEKEIQIEMLYRDAGTPNPNANPKIKDLADKMDATYAKAAAERTASGEAGAETLKARSGYFQRKWNWDNIQTLESAMVKKGLTAAQAKLKVIDAMTIGISRANGWDTQISQDIAKAIYSRVESKGMFDSAMMSNSAEGLDFIRSTMAQANVPAHRIEAAIEKLVGVRDEAGKAPTLKNRIKMDMFEPIAEGKSLHDLIDSNMGTMLDKYLDRSAATAAMARKGIIRPSDLANLRKEFLAAQVDTHNRQIAADLFDNTIKSLRGEPVGEGYNDFLRGMMGFTQMVGLKMSGLFQLTEYHTMMSHYGVTRVVGEMLREMPVLKSILGDAKESSHLASVLSANVTQDMRIGPYITRMENNWDIHPSAQMLMRMQQAKQMIPYANGSKWIMAHQARVAGNLMADTFMRAAKGDVKAVAVLEQYGLESGIIAQIKQDVLAGGMDTAKWSSSTWQAVRGPMGKMTDDMILKNRLGELPAFFTFSTVGQFLGTFRSFVFGAHNKVLAGTLHREGAGGLALLMAYQLPLTYSLTAAMNTVSGKPPQTVAQTMSHALGSSSSMGLFSELIDAAFNGKTKLGTPATTSVDKVYGAMDRIGSGDALGLAKIGLSNFPIIGAFPGMKAMGHAATPPKETK